MRTTPHYDRVRAFMKQAQQQTPEAISIPDEETRLLRAKLILEEALETVRALGVTVEACGSGFFMDITEEKDDPVELRFMISGDVDIEGVADGCADISVVTVGTLIAFGLPDAPLLEEVDAANLRKFGPGGYRREDGKWMKPPDWAPPNIAQAVGLPF